MRQEPHEYWYRSRSIDGRKRIIADSRKAQSLEVTRVPLQGVTVEHWVLLRNRARKRVLTRHASYNFFLEANECQEVRKHREEAQGQQRQHEQKIPAAHGPRRSRLLARHHVKFTLADLSPSAWELRRQSL